MTSRRQCPRGGGACECLDPPPSGNPVSAPDIYNQIIIKGVSPDAWKIATVIPILGNMQMTSGLYPCCLRQGRHLNKLFMTKLIRSMKKVNI